MSRPAVYGGELRREAPEPDGEVERRRPPLFVAQRKANYSESRTFPRRGRYRGKIEKTFNSAKPQNV